MWAGWDSRARCWSEVVDFLDLVRSHALWLVLWVVVCLGVAAAFLHSARPEFVATTQLELAPQTTASDGPEEQRLIHQMRLDALQMQTQLMLIQSDSLLGDVFDALDLAGAPELAPGRDTPVRLLLRLWRGPPPPDVARRLAFARFKDRVRARRIGLSYVVEVSYWAQSPEQAARVANAVASAFLRDRVQAAIADARVGSPYLQRRIDGLMRQGLLATGAMKTGTVPATALPDADARALGDARPPLGKAYPRGGPVLALAASLALISGLLAAAILRRANRTVRTRRQLRERLGLVCLGRVPRLPAGPGLAASGDLARTLEATRAALAARGVLSGARRVGVVSCRHCAGAEGPLAAALSDLMAAAHPPAGPGGAAEPAARILPLAASAELRLPADRKGLDAAVLVAAAGRTSLAEIQALVGALGGAGIATTGLILTGRRSARA